MRTSNAGWDDAAVKHDVLGVEVNAIDYREAVDRILAAARAEERLTVSALAVHGVMTGVNDPEHRARLNRLDVLTPDGQPVRWALRLLHGVRLADRVYGPTLTLHVCERAAREGVPVFFYGSRTEVLDELRTRLVQRFPGLIVAGTEASKFRTIDADEKRDVARRIRASGARIVFVGLGCPRQEVFAYEFGDLLALPLLAVGAAFDYHAGLLEEPPAWVQRSGLQWAFRLAQEPARLWRRYVVTNTQFVTLLALQRLGLWHPRPELVDRAAIEEIGYG